MSTICKTNGHQSTCHDSPPLDRWMKREGGWVNDTNLVINETSECLRGVFSRLPSYVQTEGSQQWVRVISIPTSLLISRKVATKYLKMTEISTHQDLSSFSTHEVLVIFLMIESSRRELKKSFWHVYLLTLPENYTNPLFADKEEIELTPPYLRKVVDRQFVEVERSWEKVSQLLRELTLQNDSISSEGTMRSSFEWAYFTVNSRAVHFNDRGDSDGQNLALAPFLDMFNHDESVETKVEVASDTYVLYVKEATANCASNVGSVDVSSQRQIFINYGPHSNMRLYLDYGFVLPSLSDHDSIPVYVCDFNFSDDDSCKYGNMNVAATGDLFSNMCLFIPKSASDDLASDYWDSGVSYNLWVFCKLKCEYDKNNNILLNSVHSITEEECQRSPDVVRMINQVVLAKKSVVCESISKFDNLKDCRRSESGTICLKLLDYHLQILNSVHRNLCLHFDYIMK